MQGSEKKSTMLACSYAFVRSGRLIVLQRPTTYPGVCTHEACTVGRVAATTPGAVPYPENSEPGKPGIYWAKADETCQKVGHWWPDKLTAVYAHFLTFLHRLFDMRQIAKMFGVDAMQLVQINKVRYPMLLSQSKLKKDTEIHLPPPDMRWILTKQISKTKPEGKKKRIYSVQVLRAPALGASPLYTLAWRLLISRDLY